MSRNEQLQAVLEAAQWTPSWANTQVWEVIVVRDTETKARLQGAISKGNPATKAMVTAPVVLALCAKTNSSGYYNNAAMTKFGDWMLFDLGLATQSICLAAHDMGLGTVIVGLFDHDKTKEILDVPEGFELAVMIPMGVPAKVPPAPKRKAIEEFTHNDKF